MASIPTQYASPALFMAWSWATRLVHEAAGEVTPPCLILGAAICCMSFFSVFLLILPSKCDELALVAVKVFATDPVDVPAEGRVVLGLVVEGDDRPISFQGGVNDSFAPPVGVVEYVPTDIFASRQARKRLVTSGLGGVFPPGLTIGNLIRAEPSADGTNS